MSGSPVLCISFAQGCSPLSLPDRHMHAGGQSLSSTIVLYVKGVCQHQLAARDGFSPVTPVLALAQKCRWVGVIAPGWGYRLRLVKPMFQHKILPFL